jgi:UDP-glucose 4-epimerase
MRVLLTGAGGLIGRYCAKVFATAGYEVIGIVRNKPVDEFWDDSGVSTNWLVDLASKNSVDQLCDLNNGLKFDAFVHCAADMSAITSDNQAQHALYRNNIDSLWNILGFRQICSTPTFLYFSTFFVSYLEQSQQMQSVMSPYTLSKMHGESLCRMFVENDEFRLMVVRPSFVYGFIPQQDDLISKWLQLALLDDELHVASDGETIRNYVYVKDVANAVLKMLETRTTGTYLMIHPEDISFNGVITAIADVMSPKLVMHEYVDMQVSGFSTDGLRGARFDHCFRTIEQGITHMKRTYETHSRNTQS